MLLLLLLLVVVVVVVVVVVWMWMAKAAGGARAVAEVEVHHQQQHLRARRRRSCRPPWHGTNDRNLNDNDGRIWGLVGTPKIARLCMCEMAAVLHGVFAPEVQADVRLVESDNRARLELATLLRRACRDPEANRHVRHRVYDNASVRRRRLRDAT